ncbi:MAG: hypothetical protein IPL02_12635 [Moraxellaceae bacterium]|nr:hypothetical protein [Moraxellaceae bacterium]
MGWQTEEQAKAAGLRLKAGQFPFAKLTAVLWLQTMLKVWLSLLPMPN